MRMSRYVWSDAVSPWMACIALLAPCVREYRRRAAAENPLVVLEGELKRAVSESVNAFRKLRDQTCEVTFKATYA